MHYDIGTSSVQARMCSTSKAYFQYERGCAVQIRNIFNTSEDVQYKQAGHKVLVQGTLLKILSNELILLLLLHPLKTAGILWQAAKIN